MIQRCFQAHKTIRWWQVHKATIFRAKSSQTIPNISPAGIFENIQSLQQKRRIPTGIFFDYCIHFNNTAPTNRRKLKILKVCTRFSTMQCLQYRAHTKELKNLTILTHHRTPHRRKIPKSPVQGHTQGNYFPYRDFFQKNQSLPYREFFKNPYRDFYRKTQSLQYRRPLGRPKKKRCFKPFQQKNRLLKNWIFG